MPLNLSDFITRDLIYKQHPDGSYVIDNDDLVEENMNDVVDSILNILEAIYTNIITINKVNPGEIRCNTYLLGKALSRYSRNIFGQQRLEAKLEHLQKTGRLTQNQKDNLSKYYDYGFKINSKRPYLHRKVSNLLYWLSVLKPFSIYPEDNSIVRPLGVAFDFHNEYMSYFLILAFLRTCNRTTTLHKNGDIFFDFLYELHFRNLSRSSLEFFLYTCIQEIKN